MRDEIADEIAEEELDEDRIASCPEEEWPPLPIEQCTTKYRKCLRRVSYIHKEQTQNSKNTPKLKKLAINFCVEAFLNDYPDIRKVEEKRAPMTKEFKPISDYI